MTVKQIVQNFRTGDTQVVVLPAPAPAAGHLIIQSTVSLVSSGTERMLVEFGRSAWLDKVRQQPEKVRQVLEKVRTDGLLPTLEAVTAKLEEPLPLGYCNVGRVIQCGADVTDFAVGDRVLSNGFHASVVRVPTHLCARIPISVPDESAVFGVLGAIALQSVRLVAPTIGETVVVIGLGLIGLLAVQILRANGCRVLALDFSSRRVDLARRFGCETLDLSRCDNPAPFAQQLTAGHGVDAVLIAAATPSSEPVRQAAAMCRKRGRIVLVGSTGLDLVRADFYQKELSFQVSCSYGPGRYDPRYEEEGYDYPIGFVRWTEQRNLAAVLHLMSEGRIDVAPLITHRFDVDSAPQAYQVLLEDREALGIVLQYAPSGGDGQADLQRTVSLPAPAGRAARSSSTGIGIAMIGAGNFAMRVLGPAFARNGAFLSTAVTTGSVRGWGLARKFGFARLTTDASVALSDPDADAVVIATRHDSHAALVCAALSAGKHVFVEKPLAVTHAQLDEITAALGSGTHARPVLTVGFNRRFAPLIVEAKKLLSRNGVRHSFIYTINAGSIDRNHWTQSERQGGGRIIGEACHFIDLLRFLADSPIAYFSVRAMNGDDGTGSVPDTVAITLTFANGSLGAIQYFSNGGRAFPKERLEIFSNGAVLQLDNFKSLRGFNWPGFRSLRRLHQDKGHNALVDAFARAVRGNGPEPIPADEIIEVSRVTIDCSNALAR